MRLDSNKKQLMSHWLDFFNSLY